MRCPSTRSCASCTNMVGWARTCRNRQTPFSKEAHRIFLQKAAYRQHAVLAIRRFLEFISYLSAIGRTVSLPSATYCQLIIDSSCFGYILLKNKPAVGLPNDHYDEKYCSMARVTNEEDFAAK